MPETTPLNILYPLPGDLLKTTTSQSKLSDDLKAMAFSIDNAIVSSSFYKSGTLSESYKADSLNPGFYFSSNVTNDIAAGLPDRYPSMLITSNIGSSAKVQLAYSLKGNTYKRSSMSNNFSDWVQEGGGVARRELLKAQLLARKGGSIGTSGKGAVALRFDDYPADFREKVLPLLVERNLPFTRVIPSDSVHQETISDREFDLMQEYCLNHGGEVWNHGRTHGNATNMGDVYRELITSRLDLEQKLPRLYVDCFAPAGGSVQFGGYMPSNNIANYSDNFAGQQVIENHALVTGYFQDAYWWQLDGKLKDGYNHYSCDAYNFERMKQYVDWARDEKVGFVLMWHSRPFDTDDSMTLADFEKFLDYLVEQRNYGGVEVLTVSGLAVADKESTYRHDILKTHGSPSTFSETVTYSRYRKGIPGSTRELTATVEGNPGDTVTSIVGESTKTHQIPASGYLNLRHVCTIPKDVIHLSVSISAPAQNVHLYAV